jgi:GDP-mannose 6-dehydrogenase
MSEHLVVSIFGVGYVGAVSAGCLAKLGHHVIAIDSSPEKVAALAAGRSPVVEPQLDQLLAEAVQQGRLTTTQEPERAVKSADVVMVCVGTPSNPNGSLNTKFAETVSRQIGCALCHHSRYPLVVFRSTILPGKVEELMIPLLEETSGKRAGKDFGIAVNPEFLRQGSAVKDFLQPPFTLIGTPDPKSAAILGRLYADISAPFICTDLRTAAAVKYACNAFHAVKITFANEIGSFCKAHGVDSHRVMDILCQDHRLNISSAYLRPGYAFGGSCLPKDLSALLHQARRSDVSLPLLEGAHRSNAQQIQHAVEMVCAAGHQRVGLIGLSFKPGTDDFRGSPLVLLAEGLLGRGYNLRIYDPDVVLGRLIGTNKQFVESAVPHLSTLVTDRFEDVLEHAETLVIGKRLAQLPGSLQAARPELCVIDLIRLSPDEIPPGICYQGIAW